MVHDEENKIFSLAADFVMYSNKSLFLTGKAGTGKTTFLKYIKEHCTKKLAVTAPTGVAAINAGGVTLHSFFHLPFGTYLPDRSSGWGESSHQFYNRKQLLENLRLRQNQRELIRSLDLLIIDEVSMVRADLLDAVDTVMRSVRRVQDKPFGGAQVLLIGDLFQLPPVVTNEEEYELYEHYRSPFFFDARVINELDLVSVTLKKIYRQQDERFINILNKVRNNNCGDEEYEFLNRYYKPNFVPDDDSGLITLTTHNKTANRLNESALERLPGKASIIEASVIDTFPESSYPAEWELRLKVGAQVMFIKNDPAKRYFNGKIGKVEDINREEKTLDISFPENDEMITVEPETWNNIQYQYDEEKDEIKEKHLGSFSQFPLRLAWAVTIHKSQGLTFEKAIIDAGRSFAPGQVYVALSRLTGLGGLILHSKITPDCIYTNSRIVEFTAQEFSETDYIQILEDAQKDYAVYLLLNAYEWQYVDEACMLHYQGLQNRQIPDVEKARTIAGDLLDAQSKLKKVAVNFQKALEQLFVVEDYKKISERNNAASEWFLGEIEKWTTILKQHIQEQEGKSKVKTYVQDLSQLLAALERKKEMIHRSKMLSSSLAVSSNIREAMLKLNEPIVTNNFIPVVKKKAKGESKRVSLMMFQQGKSILEIAKERGLVESTIAGHLIDFIPTGEVKFTDFVTVDDALKILEKAKTMENPTSGALKEALEDKFSYIQIRAALSVLEKGKVNNGVQENLK